MDGHRFDDLTRMLGRTTSRRRAAAALTVAALSALGRGRAPAALAQAPACGSGVLYERCGGCGNCAPSGRKHVLGNDPLTCRANHAFCNGDDASDDNCATCDPASLTCTAGRRCGPCESCFSNRGCEYVASGRDGQCPDPATAPCMRATGKCGCDDPLIYCDPDCVDPRSDRRHCGGCHKRCNACEKCQGGRCVRCDRVCEACRGGECVSTCTGQCFTDCKNAKCVEPDPPVCVCGEEGEGGPPAAKRVYLPVVGASGQDMAGVEPCGEGDERQCCAPEACCGDGAAARCCPPEFPCADASEGGRVCCPPELMCGELCCGGGEKCMHPGCCCPLSMMSPQGTCHLC